MDFELRHLRYFVAIAEEQSFTRAAERLRVAQPSLSIQIGKLERDIGVPLFVREGRGIRLTSAGQFFLDQARQLLSAAVDSVAQVKAVSAGRLGTLVIGHNSPAQYRVFPRFVPELRRRYPGISLDFRNLRSPQQFEALRHGKIHIAFAWLPVPSVDFDVIELSSELLSAVLPASHPLASDRPISLGSLAREELLLFHQADDPESSWEIRRLFEMQGLEMKIAYEADTLLSLLNFVSLGLGCSILPDYTKDIGTPGISYCSLDIGFSKRLAAVKLKDCEPVATAAFDLIKQL